MSLTSLIGPALGFAGSLFGASSAAKQADRDRQMQQELISRLSNVEFNPFSAMLGDTGFTGQGFQAGMFEPFLQQFQQGPQGIDAGRQLQDQANQGLLDILGNQGGMANQLGGMAAGQAQQLGTQGFQRGLQDFLSAGGMGALGGANALFGGGQNLLGQAAGLAGPGGAFDTAGNQFLAAQGLIGEGANRVRNADFSDLQTSALASMRRAAQPFEERAFGDLQQNLFSTGRLGSSGGGLQTEAFARGLQQADDQRFLAATNLAQQQQAQEANIGSMFGGLGSQLAGVGAQNVGLGSSQGSLLGNLAQTSFGAGSSLGNLGLNQINQMQGLRGLEDNLLNNAFSRFGQTTGLATDLSNQLFNRGGVGFNQGFQQLGGIGNVMQQLLEFGKFGANLGATQSNVDIAKAGGQADIMNNFGPTGSDLWGAFGTTLGSNLLQSGGGLGGLFNSLGGMFSGSSSGGGGAPGGGGGGFSDRRLKENLEHIGTDERGYKWYTWDWNSQAKLLGAHKYMPMGVIADEVLEVNPDAVMEDESGFLKVNYGAL